MAAMATAPRSTVSSLVFFFFFIMLIFCFSYDNYLDHDNGHENLINTNTTNTSTNPQVTQRVKRRWQQQQPVEARDATVAGTILFLFLFITLMFILGSLNALKRGWQHQHQHQGLETQHVSSRL